MAKIIRETENMSIFINKNGNVDWKLKVKNPKNIIEGIPANK